MQVIPAHIAAVKLSLTNLIHHPILLCEYELISLKI